ncbi:D-aminoacylase [Comamonas humi]
MTQYDNLIRNVRIVDGSGDEPAAGRFDVALAGGRIAAIAPAGAADGWQAGAQIDGSGQVLAPGFIDVHTHDDTNVIRTPDMLPKVSQGITTVIVGNCGISASPVTLKGNPPDPMNLLGPASVFGYPTFAAYVAAVEQAQPAVNVAALVGHTALRSNHMDRFDRPATEAEVAAMRGQLQEALDHGALGLSTGLAYPNAYASTPEEVMGLAEPLAAAGALYTTHLRTEFAAILDAMEEAYAVGKHARVPLIISHLKCAGPENWGRAGEVLDSIDAARRWQPVACDCYPYTASSTTIDLKQVRDDIEIFITWSDPHPQMAGQTLKEIAAAWGVDTMEAARRLQPGGAVYHNMSAADLERILAHPSSVVGSDGLPNDPNPHPRLWGSFPRVLGHFSRDRGVLTLAQAVRKMSGQSAERFALAERGLVREGWWADLVLFDPETVRDVATFTDPKQPAVGIAAVWVNGQLSYRDGVVQPAHAGRFLRRGPRNQAAFA